MPDAGPQPNRCLDAAEVEALLRGELDAPQRAACEAHLQGCPKCRQELAERRADNSLLRELRTAHARSRSDPDPPAAPAGASKAEAPVEIAGFDILEQLHRGGQGVVYKARQHRPHRLVALKVLRDDAVASTRDRARFDREIELAASLRHPNIVTVYEVGMSGGRRYFAMEYVDGLPLDRYLAEHGLPLRARVELLLKICRAVQAAHQRGVIHRDLKPGNLLVDDEGEPRVLDFGIARPTDNLPSSQGKLTFTGEFVGTLAYCAPEQVSGDADRADVRSDVYALGVVAFEMLTGRLPHDLPADLAEALRCIREAAPLPPTRIRSGIDNDLETIVLQALAKDMDSRYSSVEALAHDLERYLNGEPIAAKRDSPWYVLRKSVQRHRVAVGAAAGAFVLLALFGATMALLYQRAERAAQRALRTQRFLQETLSSANAWSLGPDATLLEVLAQAERAIQTDLANQPDVEAELRYTLGLTYASVRHDAAAQRHLQGAYAFYARDPGSNAERVATCLANLGRIQGSIPDARRAAELWRRQLGDDAPETLLARLDLAYVLTGNGAEHYDEADSLFTDVTERLRARYGAEHRYVARATHVHGWLRAGQGQLVEAESLLRQALQVHLAQGIPDPYECELFDHYATVLTRLGQLENADRVLAQAAQVLPAAFGREWQPKLLWRRAELHAQMGQGKAAEMLYRQALGVRCLHVADSRPRAAPELQRLAAGLLSPPASQAPAAYADVIDTLWREQAADDALLVRWACDLAEALLMQGRITAAGALLRAAQQRQQQDPYASPEERARVLNLLQQVAPATQSRPAPNDSPPAVPPGDGQ